MTYREQKAKLVRDFALAAKEQGFEAFIAESGTHGFYTNGERVVSFQYDLLSISVGGNYLPGAGCGSGWRITDSAAEERIGDYIKMGAPHWATKGSAVTLTTKAQYLATYQDSSKFKQV